MFKNNKIDLGMINPSSKMALKLSCIQACQGNVERAKELYDFLSEGVESIPDFEIPRPTAMQQAQEVLGNIFGWVKNNKDDIMQAVGYIQSLRGSAAGVVPPTTPTPMADIPPLPTK